MYPWPIVGEQEVQWMEEVVRSGKWSWMGPHEQAFCEDFRQLHRRQTRLCLANGTVTIQCALQAVGVQPGDEVIVPGLTWVATAQAAIDIGAQVVLVDIDPETFTASIRGRRRGHHAPYPGHHPRPYLWLHVRHGRHRGAGPQA
jgi:dTDP-4-amino-4,6-dideoxygalactose transaminase